MTEVTQTKLHDPPNQNGNCYRACIASILEIGIDDIPEIEEEVINYWPVFLKWLEEKDLQLAWLYQDPRCLCIASGYTERFVGVAHAVVWNGGVAWDPHPSRAGFRDDPHMFEIILRKGIWQHLVL